MADAAPLDIRIERAGRDDLAALAALVEQVRVPGWSRDSLAASLDDATSVALVARAAGTCGFALGRRAADEIEVLLVAVAHAARRRGVGRALVDALLAGGARHAHLEVRGSNRAAIALYGRAGFVATGLRKRYYADGEDALTMSRTVETALPLRVDAVVRENVAEGDAGFRLALDVDGAWTAWQPGQFVMLSPGAIGAAPRHDPLLPRPMAIYRERAGAVEILYKVSGRGTQLLSEARPGARVRMVGPLGAPFELPTPGRRAILVGGGTGIASLYELAAQARSRGAVAVLLGARRAGDLMGGADFESLGVELGVATEDGSRGRRGLVTELLEDALRDAREPAVVYACGPTPMMRRAAEIAAARGVPCSVSLENRMACGFGVCLGCAVPRADGTIALVCRDGPIFDAAAVGWAGVP